MPIRVRTPDGGVAVFPDGTDPSVMEAALRAQFGGGEKEPSQHPHAKVARMVGDNLPSIGGMVGGALGAIGGPVVAAGTAALGGAAGRLGQRVLQGIQRRPEAVTSQGEMVADAARSGAIQGGVQAVGGVVGKGLSAGANRLYQGLAKPSKALREGFDDLVPQALKDRIPLTTGGGARAERLLGQSHDAAEKIISTGHNAGKTITPREMTSELGAVTRDLQLRARAGQVPEFDAVARTASGITRRNPSRVPLGDAQAIKRKAQEAAQGAYKKMNAGNASQLSGADMAQEAVARGTRKAIERQVPEVAKANALTQSRIGVDRMVSDATSREGNTLMMNGLRDVAAVGAGAGLGSLADAPEAGAGAGLLLRLLSTPSHGSRAAILASEAARLKVPEHALRALMAAYEQEQ
jgi:hypothetical protein